MTCLTRRNRHEVYGHLWNWYGGSYDVCGNLNRRNLEPGLGTPTGTMGPLFSECELIHVTAGMSGNKKETDSAIECITN